MTCGHLVPIADYDRDHWKCVDCGTDIPKSDWYRMAAERSARARRQHAEGYIDAVLKIIRKKNRGK